MNTLLKTQVLFALALAASAGCDDPEGGFADGEVSLRPGSSGGILFNTFAWGKTAGGELDRLGALWADARLAAVELRCTTNTKDMWRFPKVCQEKGTLWFKLEDVQAYRGELRGMRDGLKFDGADFLGSKWTISLYEGGVFKTKHVQEIKAYEFDPLQKPHPLHYYNFMFFGDGTNGGEKGTWTPACTEEKDPITGQVIGSKTLVYDDITVNTTTGVISKRSDTLYLGCISAAVGKAGNWGFPSWEIGAEDFTTAVRTVRADYCGDGDSWTTVGNALQVDDVWGYSDFANPLATTEAIWGEKGAVCLGTPRWIGTYAYSDVICNGAKLKPCGTAKLSSFTEATMWSKLP